MPYNIYRDGSLIAANVLTEEYTDTDLEYGKEYSYQISSLNFYGESELSPVVKVTTLPLTLDVNGTVKTGTFAEKTLDEDAYDDLAKKDSNTIYKVYPEGGNPDEAAWFLGEQVIDKATEGGNVVYGRNLATNSSTSFTTGNAEGALNIYAGGNKAQFVSHAGDIVTAQADISNATQTTTIRLVWVNSDNNVVEDGANGTSIAGEGVVVVSDITPNGSNGARIALRSTSEKGGLSLKYRRVKVEAGESATPWTPAPEDVAIFTEATGGAAA